MNTFTINNVTYNARKFDFNLMCDFEEMGITMEQIQNKPMSTLRAYFTLCCGNTTEFAGLEMQNHMINGGSLDGIIEAMNKEINDSDFFRGLSKETETSNPKGKAKKNTEA